ncbi:MAG: hypothetical protein A2075_19525 [Geobacteraceae bacterium GWC2_58_44]|nr:MAG: hypothetical protein A2075_19525 [Geobacteraceae bacterium GWC2_58_44]
MGVFLRRNSPIPTPTLPLKGREFFQRKIIANQDARGRRVRPGHSPKEPRSRADIEVLSPKKQRLG